MSIVKTSVSTTLQNAAGQQQPHAQGMSLQDFYAYLPTHQYIVAHSADIWPSASVNAQVEPMLGADGKPIRASDWLDRNRPIEQMVWAPGKPQVIRDFLMMDTGWVEASGSACFNLYRPPVAPPGDPALASPWVDHVRKLYPTEAEHLMHWFAYKVQYPGEKVNHAVVLGGNQGIGKDMMLEPVKRAVGEGNVADIAPTALLEAFNEYVQSVIVCISEASDLGDARRQAFYERTKTLIAAPPHAFRLNEKYRAHRTVQNVCGVIFTTNHKTDGIHLDPDDRRHFVAWSPLDRSEFPEGYFSSLDDWYEAGGYGHVAAFLRTLNLSDFNAKAPPPKTDAFWEIVQADQPAENVDLADALDRLGRPEVVTISALVAATKGHDLAYWLQDKANRRKIPSRLETAGYVQVRNTGASDGLWRVSGKRQAVYGRKDLLPRARVLAVDALCRGGR